LALSIFVIYAILLGLNIYVYRRLKHHVSDIESTLFKVSEHSDLSLRLNKTGNDEFVRISNNIDHHLDDICAIINKFSNASEEVSNQRTIQTYKALKPIKLL